MASSRKTGSQLKLAKYDDADLPTAKPNQLLLEWDDSLETMIEQIRFHLGLADKKQVFAVAIAYLEMIRENQVVGHSLHIVDKDGNLVKSLKLE